MSGTTISSHGLDQRRRRLLFRAWHRGTREMDFVMGGFMDAVLTALTDAELTEVEGWIDVPDPQLYAWVTGEESAPAQFDTALFQRWRSFQAG